MAGRLSVRAPGIDRVLKKVDPARPVFAEPLRRALADAGRLGEAYVRGRAGRLSGRTAAAIDFTVDPRPVPRFLRVGFIPGGPAMPTRGGFRYPGALEGSARYHYRSGPQRGRTTREWLSGGAKFLRQQLNIRLRQAAKEIEQLWAAG